MNSEQTKDKQKKMGWGRVMDYKLKLSNSNKQKLLHIIGMGTISEEYSEVNCM
jgi:hypothetical protein